MTTNTLVNDPERLVSSKTFSIDQTNINTFNNLIYFPAGTNITVSGGTITQVNGNTNFFPIISYPNIIGNALFTNIAGASVTVDGSGKPSIYLPAGRYMMDVDLSIAISRSIYLNTDPNTNNSSVNLKMKLLGGQTNITDQQVTFNPSTNEYYALYFQNGFQSMYSFMLQPSFYFELLQPSFIGFQFSLNKQWPLQTSLSSGPLAADTPIYGISYSAINIYSY